VRGSRIKKPISAVRKLIAERNKGQQLDLLGEPRANLLELNLALDEPGR
jgi:K+-transporting ATPase c subunit